MGTFMGTFARDLSLTLRTLRRTPGTALLAILVLGLGIGANSAMFSIVDTLLLEPLAIPEPERISLVLRHDVERRDWDSVSYPDFVDLRAGLRSFEDLTAHTLSMVAIGEGAEARRAFVDVVAANYFSTFGVSPALGRAFTIEEERPDAQIPVAILSHPSWQRLGGGEEIVGSQITVNGISATIVGIAPRGFSGTSALLAPELYLPLGMHGRVADSLDGRQGRSLGERDNGALMLIGRLAEDIDRAAAQADLERVSRALAEQHPATSRDVVFEPHPPSRISMSTAPQTDDELAVVAMLLLSMSMVVLLVAGFNLAAVQGSRNLARRRELAVRLALGSGRGRVVRQLLTESLVLALGGAVLGIFLAWLAPRLLVASLARLAPFDIFLDGSIDLRIVAATLGFSLLAALFVGLLPALHATRPDLADDLKEGRETGGGPRRHFGLARGDLPVTCELALSTVLLVCAGLFVHSALRGANVDPGFETERQALLEIDPSLSGYDATRTREVQDRLRRRIAAVPGVRSVALAGSTPFGMVSFGAGVGDAARYGQSTDPSSEETVAAALYTVSDGYFETLDVAILQGRGFREIEPAAVVVVDELLAQRLYGDGSALGRRIVLPGSDRLTGESEIVGVVASVRDSLFDRQRQAHVYLPASRQGLMNTQVHVATERVPDAALLAAVRGAVREVDPQLAVLQLGSFRDFLDGSFEIWTLRTAAQMFSVFAVVALLLAVAGVYGVQAYRIVQRTREIGLRVALGASTGQTVGLVLRDGARVAVLGTTVGLGLALAVAQLMRVMLVDTDPAEPVVLVLAWLALVGTAILATLVPARRAARLDPLVALREE